MPQVTTFHRSASYRVLLDRMQFAPVFFWVHDWHGISCFLVESKAIFRFKAFAALSIMKLVIVSFFTQELITNQYHLSFLLLPDYTTIPSTELVKRWRNPVSHGSKAQTIVCKQCNLSHVAWKELAYSQDALPTRSTANPSYLLLCA